jgi:PAS domain S-box-containing protein
MRRRLWLWYLGAAVLGGLGYYFFPPLAKSGPFFNVLGLSSVAAIVVGVRLHRPASKLPWVLFALGLFLFISGDFITYNYNKLFGHDIPFPSIGDVAYLAVYPCLILGILVLIKRRSPGRDRDSLLDSLIITIGAGLYSWVFLMAPYAHDHTLTPLVKMVSIAYPLMDLLVLAVVVRLVVGGGRREPSFYLLLFGALALLVTDAAYGAIQLSGVIYQNGGPLEAGWLAFYVLWGAAALHPSMRTMDEPVPVSIPKHPKRRLAALFFASLVCPFVNILQGFRGQLLDPGMVSVCSAALFTLVFIRMNRLMVDVTKYRKTENQLRATEQKYRNLVERLPAIVYSAEFGEDGGWVYVSPQIESILGYSPEEWMSQPLLWGERVHPEDLPAALADEERVLRTGAQLLCEYRILAKDGRTVWIRDEAQPLFDDQGRATLLQGVMFDVSAAKVAELTLRRALEKEQQAAGELRELHEMKNSFLHAVSHDLRTPLTAVLGSSLTLSNPDVQLTEEEGAGLLQSITNNAKKLERLLTDLLDVDRLSRGVVEPKRKRVDVRELIDRVLAECNLDRHELEIDVAPLTADVDPGQVERIVENLVANAVRYSPPGSRIVVRCAEAEDGILLSVDDSGAGVPPELRESIFEPFQQGAQRVAHSPGVGIGLSLVARFASLHGGSAWVEDADVGGASFKVFLPCTVETAERIPEPASGRSDPVGRGPVQVRAEVGP